MTPTSFYKYQNPIVVFILYILLQYISMDTTVQAKIQTTWIPSSSVSVDKQNTCWRREGTPPELACLLPTPRGLRPLRLTLTDVGVGGGRRRRRKETLPQLLNPTPVCFLYRAYPILYPIILVIQKVVLFFGVGVARSVGWDNMKKRRKINLEVNILPLETPAAV